MIINSRQIKSSHQKGFISLKKAPRRLVIIKRSHCHQLRILKFKVFDLGVGEPWNLAAVKSRQLLGLTVGRLNSNRPWLSDLILY